MSEVKLWRYRLPSIDGLEGWGVVHLDSTGFFAAVTDYGNYAYGWAHHGCADFREFFLDAGQKNNLDYYLRKLSKRDVFRSDETVEQIKRWILEHRHSGGWSEEQARREWELVCETDFDDYRGKTDWYDSTSIPDGYELFVYDYPPDAKALVYKFLPRLAEVLKAELDAERQAASA